jgi:AcrR family transcriptional regulator
MAKKRENIVNVEPILSTEQKIKIAAKEVFLTKGYAATKTRDIASVAGINLALLNYYFRSKERLFEEVMLESMGDFMQTMMQVFNQENTSLEEKIADIVNAYHELLNSRPDLPVFILSELRNGNHSVVLKATGLKKIYEQSYFIRQYKEAVKTGEYKDRPILWLIMNMMSLTIFPFMSMPLLKIIGNTDDKSIQKMLEERKGFITKWVIQTLK